MADSFRFSPRPNRASDIAWHAWGAGALDEAARLGRPVFLNLTAVWCHWCHLMDETTFSDPDIIELVNSGFVPVRVDTDRNPHVQERYIAGGWPTNAFLTPTGEVLWAGTYVDAAQLREVAGSVLDAWRERREELEQEIGRRRRALESTRGRSAASGLVRREAADDVATVMRDTFDPRNGGFGGEPKFPHTEAVELMYALAAEDASWSAMADQMLDGMLAGELLDPVEGGFFRYATAADWSAPRHEKLLETNAALLEAYATGALLRDRADWREVAARTVEWVDGTLRRADGLWAGSQSADPDYFAADAERRGSLERPPVDDSVYTSANACWIGALADAGARLGEPDWLAAAADGLGTLVATMSAPGGGMFHYRAAAGEPQLDSLLVDTLEVARAALRLAQATGQPRWLELARRLGRHMERSYWAEDGGFWDRVASRDDVGALRYPDRPFELNAAAARLLLDLWQATGERSWRALAERTLARIGPLAGRYGPAGAVFALATAEFFETPPSVYIAATTPHSETARALRQAALRLPVPRLRVWTVPDGHAVGPQRFAAHGSAAAYVHSGRGCSAALPAPDQLTAAAAHASWHA